MDFIRDLHEARMLRNSNNVRYLTYSDCCERLYLSLLVLSVMNKFPTTKPFVKNYAQRTSGYESYKHFRIHGTDLYNLIYFVTGDEDAINKLKDPGKAKQQRSRTHLPLMAVNRFITQLKTGTVPARESALFVELEQVLDIRQTEYKTSRRIINNFSSVSTEQKKYAITKLLYAARAKLRSSDLITDFSKLATLRDLESPQVKDTEPRISEPDIAVKGRDLNMYKYLVGSGNLMLTKKFIEQAKNKRSTTGEMNSAYLPIIELVDDIAKAGPAYIQLLKTLQKRARRAK